MEKIYFPNFNIQKTLLGGQTFSWSVKNDFFIGITTNRLIKVKYEREYLFWQTYPQNGDFEFIEKYFDLKKDYSEIEKTISKDKFVKKAIDKNPGIKILNQPFEDVVVSFISSSNRNIPMIRKSLKLLSEKLGGKVNLDSEVCHLFPEICKIANSDLRDLLNAKLGFRAKYIQKTANQIIESKLSEKIQSVDEEQARESLLKLSGVGEEVAECIMQFSLGFENITPIDVWTKRIFTDLYQIDSKLNYKQMREWYKEKFGGYAALAGQYLYEWYRESSSNISQKTK